MKNTQKHTAFLWEPIKVPIKWVFSSDKVPPWDASRNYPVWGYVPSSLVQQYLEVCGKKRGIVALEKRIKKWAGKDWIFQDAPSDSGLSYPRLVRDFGDEIASANEAISVDRILADFARLGKNLIDGEDEELRAWFLREEGATLPKKYYRPNNRLLNEIKKLCSTYGFINRNGDCGSLADWLNKGRVVYYHKWVLKQIGDDKEIALEQLQKDEQHPFGFNRFISDRAKGAKDIEDLRQQMADELMWMVFQDMDAPWRDTTGWPGIVATRFPVIQPLVDIKKGFTLKLQVDCYHYALYLLALAYLGNKKVKKCKGCNSLFFASYENAEFCPGNRTCQSKGYRRSKQEAQDNVATV